MDQLLDRLDTWYRAQCDGEWEHRYGVRIETLDNPGWLVRVDLHGTALEGKAFADLSESAAPDDWVSCKVEGTQFVGACGPGQLPRVLGVFLAWAEGAGQGGTGRGDQSGRGPSQPGGERP